MGGTRNLHLSTFLWLRDDLQPDVLKNPALDVIHNVELCSDDRRITAVPIDLGHGHGQRLIGRLGELREGSVVSRQAGEDEVLSFDAVRGRGDESARGFPSDDDVER